MSALWHLVYWPAIGVILLLSLLNFLLAFCIGITESVGLYAESQIYRRKQKARR